ncbi:hypothetical protein C8J57DRAFT_1329859 [Mycena rebaudengoi]|nr:hypothetical protein C8J57DRAFT_1329859 [Mycena rebaudengoi]
MVPFQAYEFFGTEVSRIWSRKFSGATVLYACLRYGTLFEKITVLFLASWYLSPHGCDIAVRVQIFPMIARTIGFGSELAFGAVPVFFMCLPSAITATYVYAHQEATTVDRYGCQMAYLASATAHDRLRIAGIAADFLSETIVIFVTGKKHPGLAMLLLKNGSSKALLILSLADMLVLIVTRVATRYDYWVVPYYTPVFRTIIICRFLLMLRAVYDESAVSNGMAIDQSIRFASRVIGPMGAPVDASSFDEDSDIEDEESVYAEDPLMAGLRMMSDAPRPAKEDMVAVDSNPRRSLSNDGSGTQAEGELV